MAHAFASIAFTPAVREAQTRDGSRAQYARAFDGPGLQNAALGAAEAAFIAAQRSFYLATVSDSGWPYVQHRGGPAGFLRVLDAQHLAFTDLPGNRQFISVGNLAGNDRVALILVDYAQRQRLKLLGRLSVAPSATGDAKRREMRIAVLAFDWNCPQHIPWRVDAEPMAQALAERDSRVAALEAALAARQPG